MPPKKAGGADVVEAWLRVPGDIERAIHGRPVAPGGGARLSSLTGSMRAPLPPNEAERLDALRRHRILDTAPEEAFDGFTRLASFICRAPVALVTLVDADRQWFKSRVGTEVRETPRDIAFCAHAILGRDLMVVRDARADPRFADNPLVVSDPMVRFYAGVPLVTPEGYGLGTLCVLDLEPRDLDASQAEALRVLSRAVAAQLELRRNVEDLERALEHRRQYEKALEEKVRLETEVAERRRVEEVLRRLNEDLGLARDQAVEASRSKSAFLDNMSHELRTPLNAVIGYAELLKEDAAESGRAEAEEPLERIVSSARHLLGLIDEILEISKMEAGRAELVVETFDIADLAREVAALGEKLAQKRGNRFELCLDGGLGTMKADRGKLRHVLFHLLSNACKFTEAGTVRLSVKRDADAGPRHVVFAVQDTGIGIAPEDVARLFKPFTQVDESRTRAHGGAGLGLALSQGFCVMMGGWIEVESAFGQGSTFTMRVPGEPRSA